MQTSLLSNILRGNDIGSYSSHGVFKPYFIEENNGNSMTDSGSFLINLIVERFQEDFQTFWIFISIGLEKQIVMQDGVNANRSHENDPLLLFPGRRVKVEQIYPIHPPTEVQI